MRNKACNAREVEQWLSQGTLGVKEISYRGVAFRRDNQSAVGVYFRGAKVGRIDPAEVNELKIESLVAWCRNNSVLDGWGTTPKP
jgi:hypothetical protein